MKFRITLKDPDGVTHSMATALEFYEECDKDVAFDELNTAVEKWFEYGEYLTVEIDTILGTIHVCTKDELT